MYNSRIVLYGVGSDFLGGGAVLGKSGTEK